MELTIDITQQILTVLLFIGMFIFTVDGFFIEKKIEKQNRSLITAVLLGIMILI